MPNTERAVIIFDASPLRYLHTGLGQFSAQLLSEFEKLPKSDFDLRVLVHPDYQWLVPRGLSIEKASFFRRHSPALIQQYLYRKCHLWHMTTENTRLMGIPRSAKVILTIHGLHFLDEETSQEASKLQLQKVQRLVNRADVITAVSHFTANLAGKKLNLGNKEIEVIHNGISFSDTLPSVPAWAPEGKFIFSIGTFFRRKNFQVLLPMIQRLPNLKLVLAGDNRQAYGDLIRSEINRLGLQERVIMPGEISEAEKTWLYQRGEALVFPSISEGFGIPLIESFHHGKPVFCGRYGSLPEIGGTHAFYWEDFDPDHMANAVRKKLEEEGDTQKRTRIEYASRFSWAHTASAFLLLYEKVLNNKGS